MMNAFLRRPSVLSASASLSPLTLSSATNAANAVSKSNRSSLILLRNYWRKTDVDFLSFWNQQRPLFSWHHQAAPPAYNFHPTKSFSSRCGQGRIKNLNSTALSSCWDNKLNHSRGADFSTVGGGVQSSPLSSSTKNNDNNNINNNNNNNNHGESSKSEQSSSSSSSSQPCSNNDNQNNNNNNNNNNSNSNANENKDNNQSNSDTQSTLQKLRALFHQYGYTFIATYIAIYLTTLVTTFLALDSGLLNPESIASIFQSTKEMASETATAMGPSGNDYGESVNDAANAYANEVSTEITTEKRTVADFVSAVLNNWKWTAKYADKVERNPHLANLVVAWVMVKFTEPVRLAVAVGVVPRVAKFLETTTKVIAKKQKKI